MKRQEAEAVLDRFFEECGNAVPAQSDVEPVLDRVWERLEWKSDEFVGARVPAAWVRPLRFGWAIGMVLVAILVSALLWRQGPPFSVVVKAGKVNEHSMLKPSSQQARETLQVTVPEDVFELASVRLLSPSSETAKAANTFEAMQQALTGCTAGYVGTAKIDPGRLTIPAVSVLTLVISAYGKDCTLVEGGPAWARSGEYYEINALLPPGTPRYKGQDFWKGNAPVLQRMLQNLLADRFRLVLKQEFREMSVYALTVANRGKMKLSPDETVPTPSGFSPPGFPPMPPVGRGGMLRFLLPSGEARIFGHAISMSDLAKELRQNAGRIVVDKTGLNDVFDVDLSFARDTALSNLATPGAPPESIPPLPGAPQLLGSPLPIALEEQLGLKLEAVRMPIEVLIIERVERPSEN